jgi:hypothetical protein
MIVNKVQVKLGVNNTDKVLQIPVMLDWELLNTENEVDKLEAQINQDIAGLGIDFETTRFSHSAYTFTPPTTNVIQPTPTLRTNINYEFYFFSGGTLNGSSSTANWITDYNAEGFSYDEIYYYTRRFTNSFFKLDFYDSPSQAGQQNYLTVIIPTTQGEQMPVVMQGQNVLINKPVFSLDFVGDTDGFFLYWLQSREYINVDQFYVSCKFYNAKTNEFTRMVNRPQSLQNINTFTVNNLFNFYYLYKFDYPSEKYVVFDMGTFERVGTTTPIKWYEYVGPNG